MGCSQNSHCYTVSLSLPDFPPPPPLPSFLLKELNLENLTGNGVANSFVDEETCDLCSRWGDSSTSSAGQVAEGNFTLVLAIVAVISALCGAGVMAVILRIRRLKNNRKFQSGTDTMRHLERKCNEQSLPLPPSRSTNSTPVTNTYCEGPYSDKEYPNNIYAELSAGVPDVWRRPRPPIPTPENCYLELRDLPGSCETLQRLQPPGYSPAMTTTSSYYTDLDSKSTTQIQ